MRRLMGVLVFAACLAIAFAGGVAWRTWAGTKKADARKPLYYVDPMHPWYKSDKPGIAPDCGMKLEPVYDAAHKQVERKPLYYRDPKQPAYHAAAPGINPETGNDLEPVYEETSASSVEAPAGKQDLMGLTFGTVETTSDAAAIHTTGRIALDETRIVRVHAKTDGWVEKTFVNYTGQLVRKGQPMLTMYSPELLASQQELLLALKARENMHHSSMQSLQLSGESLVEAARRRLSLWDLTPAQISEIEETGKPVKAITLYAPADGYVTEREAFPNQKIGPEMKLYTLADLGRVWVMADLFEADAQSVRPGTAARISVPGSARPLLGTVNTLQPVLQAASRTLQARIELPNPGYRLKPDMWVEVDLEPAAAKRLTVPAEAVIDSGTSKVVYVDRGNGKLEPRPVETGARFGSLVEVTRGLAQGERIVTSGAFLLNSESQMRSGQPHD